MPNMSLMSLIQAAQAQGAIDPKRQSLPGDIPIAPTLPESMKPQVQAQPQVAVVPPAPRHFQQGYAEQLDNAFYNQMGQRQNQVAGLQQQVAELQNDPNTLNDVNLKPLLAYVDSLTNGHSAQSYTAPETRKSQVAKLQAEIAKGQNAIGDDQLAYLKQKASEEAARRAEGRANSALSRTMLANEFKLRNEWDGDPITKNTKGVAEGWQKIQQAATGATDPATYMTLVYGLMKMQDPGSTVREGEFKTGEGIGGWPEQAKVFYQKATGAIQGGITQKQIDAILSQANNIKEAQLARQGLVDNQYATLASEYGFRPEHVVLKDIFKDPASNLVTVSNGKESFKISRDKLRAANQDGYQEVK